MAGCSTILASYNTLFISHNMFAKYSMHSGNLKLILNINFVVDARMYPEVHTFFFVNDLGPLSRQN